MTVEVLGSVHVRVREACTVDVKLLSRMEDVLSSCTRLPTIVPGSSLDESRRGSSASSCLETLVETLDEASTASSTTGSAVCKAIGQHVLRGEEGVRR